MDSEPLFFWGWDAFERGMLTIPALLAAALAMVAARFVAFGLWIAATVWIESRTTIENGILRCGYTGGAYRLAEFRAAERAEYRAGFGRRRGFAVIRIQLTGDGAVRARCNTFIRPSDPKADELLTAVRARLAR